jgi:hypothetical protein
MKKHASNFTNSQYAYGWLFSLILIVVNTVGILESQWILVALIYFTYVFQIGFLIKHSSYLNWQYFRLNNLFVAVLIIALLLRVQHIEGSDELMMVAALGPVVLYLIYLLKKAVFKVSKVLKVAFLATFLSLRLGKHLHLIRYDDWLFDLSNFLLLFLILTIHVEQYQGDKNWFKK